MNIISPEQLNQLDPYTQQALQMYYNQNFQPPPAYPAQNEQQQQQQQQHYAPNDALLGRLQQQYLMDQRQQNQSVVSLSPGQGIPPQPRQNYAHSMAPSSEYSSSSTIVGSDDGVPAVKEKKSTSFLKKAFVPSSPSFWSPRPVSDLRRKKSIFSAPSAPKKTSSAGFSGGRPPATAVAAATTAISDVNTMPGSYPTSPVTSQQHQTTVAPPPPPPPFALPNIPAGGYLYYCPPAPAPAMHDQGHAPSSPVAAQRAQNIRSRPVSTVYNPRQVPNDRCIVM